MKSNSTNAFLRVAASRRRFLALSAVAAAGSRIPLASAQDKATPASDLLVKVAEQTADLDGKERIWQINRIVVQDDHDHDQDDHSDDDHDDHDDDDDAKFRVRLGFAYAHEIPIDLDFEGDHDDHGAGNDVILAVGEGVAIRDRDEIEADAEDASIGSFYTLELIDPADVNNDGNRLAIGTPFATDSQTYTLTLWRGDASAGSTISFGEGGANALVLVLDGSLTYTHDGGEATTLAPGEAASGTGAGQVDAGDQGASFLAVTLATGDTTA